MRLVPQTILMFCLSLLFGAVAKKTEPPAQVNPNAIVPGERVGLLRLGDTRDRALELFPYKPNMDQQWREGTDCGTTLNWLDMKKSGMAGNVFIRFKEDRVFQIDSATSTFRTADGVTISSSPREVRKKYPGMHAYVLSEGWSEAVGDRPLIYWLDSEKGIAFAFAYSRSERQRYLNGIVVFQPHTDVCPQYPSLSRSDKRELPPYSLEAEDH